MKTLIKQDEITHSFTVRHALETLKDNLFGLNKLGWDLDQSIDNDVEKKKDIKLIRDQFHKAIKEVELLIEMIN